MMNNLETHLPLPELNNFGLIQPTVDEIYSRIKEKKTLLVYISLQPQIVELKQYFEDKLMQNPNDCDLLLVLSIFFQISKNYNEEDYYLHRILQINPNYSRAWNNLGNLFKNIKKDYNEAEKCYKKSIEINPNDNDTWERIRILLDIQYFQNSLKF